MIKNERQYKITKAQTDRFAKSLKEIEKGRPSSSVHPILLKAQKEALKSQYDELLSEVRAYEALKAGEVNVLEVQSFNELPSALIQARIALGLSQKNLADKLAIKEQQIQRYEANNFANASLTRIKQIVDALGIRIKEELFLPQHPVSLETLFDRLNTLGIPKEFIIRRLLSQELASIVQDTVAQTYDTAFKVASTVASVFDITVSSLLSNDTPVLNFLSVGSTRFKTSSYAEESRLKAYTIYANRLAHAVLKATSNLEQSTVPTDPKEVRQAIMNRYGRVVFETTLKYVWSLGIPVIPLNDLGTFHGACWRYEGRNIIVLKQQNMSLARWLYDLLHELRHTAEVPGEPSFAIIEDSPISPDRQDSEDEENANYFAEDIILDGKSDRLEESCEKESKGSLERLKNAVTRVASQEGIEVDSLANHMAYRLSEEGQDWWGTASNLQRNAPLPLEYAREILIKHLDLTYLNELEKKLLMRALED